MSHVTLCTPPTRDVVMCDLVNYGGITLASTGGILLRVIIRGKYNCVQREGTVYVGIVW